MSEDNLSGAPEATPEDPRRDDVRRDEVVANDAPEPVQPQAERDQTFPAETAAADSNEMISGESPLDGVEYGEASLHSLSETAEAAETESVFRDTAVAVAEGSDAEDPFAQLRASVPEMPGEERPRSTLAEWTITILLLLFLTTTLVQAYVIPTGSMEDTLLIGDHLLVDKLAYAPPGPVSKWILPYTEVKRGDIIVFRYPVDISQTFVKRAIGVPGDRIRIINKEVYLNGVKLNEPYTYHKLPYIDSYRDNFPGEPNTSIEQGAYDMLANDVVNGEVVVPPKSYFALGDNRDSSLDSRFWGFVPRENIIGKPLIIYWSYDAPTEDLNTSSISLRHVVDLTKNFFTKTRWNRTFQLIHGYPLE